MKYAILFAAGTSLLFLQLLVSCGEKDDLRKSTVPPRENKPPKAVAGDDQIIELPNQQHASLNGTSSSDPENDLSLVSSHWTKISGPELLSMFNSPGIADVSFISAGQYIFEFTAKDNRGLSSKDTLMVSVKWSDNCSQKRENVLVTTFPISISPNEIPQNASFVRSGSKLFFAGGTIYEPFWVDEDFSYSSQLNMFDLNTGSWSKLDLSEAKTNIASIAAGGLVFFAGGKSISGYSKTVEIFDPLSQLITKAELSVGRSNMAVAEINNKVFFAGGFTPNNIASDVVDVYDLNSHSWSVLKLSEPRADISAVTMGDNVYFVGGTSGPNGPASKKIDILNLGSGQWSAFNMLTARGLPQIAVLGTKIAIAGGYSTGPFGSLNINSVEFFDASTHVINEDCLFAGESSYSLMGNNIKINSSDEQVLKYLSDGILSSYDLIKNSWKISAVPEGMCNGLIKTNEKLISMKYVPGPGWYTGNYHIVKIEY
jgi:hypothetical protein